MRLLPRLVCAVVFATTAALAHALTVAELQQLLQGPRPDVRYEEVRESPWLSSPVTTRGTLHVTAQALEKRVESPRKETWRMLEDRVEWIGPDAGRRQILFSQAPALQALAEVTRRALAGDLSALERDFRISVQGDERGWSAQLQPRGGPVASQLESVLLQGAGKRLQVLIVSERGGERTTTRVLP